MCSNGFPSLSIQRGNLNRHGVGLRAGHDRPDLFRTDDQIHDRNRPEEQVSLPCSEGTGSIEVVSYTPNKVILSASTSCDAYLSSSEIFYPGWHAYIDDKEVAIYESNIAFRTLFVSAGKHTITYEYKPMIFIIGGAITFVTGVFLIWLLRKGN